MIASDRLAMSHLKRYNDSVREGMVNILQKKSVNKCVCKDLMTMMPFSPKGQVNTLSCDRHGLVLFYR